jgi:hypothetical protein
VALLIVRGGPPVPIPGCAVGLPTGVTGSLTLCSRGEPPAPMPGCAVSCSLGLPTGGTGGLTLCSRGEPSAPMPGCVVFVLPTGSVVFNPAALSQPSSTPFGSRYHLTFKMVQAEAKICSQILHAHGFQEVSSSNQDFNIMWTGSHPNPHIFKSMLPHQRVNHFPRSYELTRKDRMYKNIERLQISKGPKHFNFIPNTFTIPNEYSEFAAAHHRTRGKGVFVIFQ